MAILNYRDPTTQQWVALDAPTGPTGSAGPTGPPGPIGVSGDTGNAATISAFDGLVFVPGVDTSAMDTDFVNLTGDTMTGELSLPDQVTVPPPVVPTAVAARGYVDQVITVSNVDPTGVPARDGLIWNVVADVVAPLPPTPVTGRYLRYIENLVTWTDTPDPTVTGYEVYYSLGTPTTEADTLLGTVLPGVLRIVHAKDDAAIAADIVYYGVRAVGPGGVSDLTQATVVRPESFSMWDLYGGTFLDPLVGNLPGAPAPYWDGKDIVFDIPSQPSGAAGIGWAIASYPGDPANIGFPFTSAHPWQVDMTGATGLWREFVVELTAGGNWAGGTELLWLDTSWWSPSNPNLQSQGYIIGLADSSGTFLSAPWHFLTWDEAAITPPDDPSGTLSDTYPLPDPGYWSNTLFFIQAGMPTPLQIRIKTEECRFAWGTSTQYASFEDAQPAQEEIAVKRAYLDPAMIQDLRNEIRERTPKGIDNDRVQEALLRSLNRLTEPGQSRDEE